MDYVLGRVGSEPDTACLEQRAFYRLRRASIRLFQVERSAIKPRTLWTAVLPARNVKHNWRLLHQATGIPQWPGLTLFGRFPKDVQTVGGTARYLASEAKAALKGEHGWNREEIEATVARLMQEKLGIRTFRWDQEFVRDLGVD